MRNGLALQVLDSLAFQADLEAFTGIYRLAMQPPPEQLAGRRAIMQRHSVNPDFRAVAVMAGAGTGPVAFAYGFTGGTGQWWHDVVQAGLIASAGVRPAAAWLADAFEVAEVHVRPDFQRRGIGRSMLLRLTGGCPHRTALLSTLDLPSPARRLYRSLGFGELLTGFLFPGNVQPYVIMGAVLPLRGDAIPGASSPRPAG